ncbi:hypothetical protein [Phyllobacterium zundukense]|uniref:Uncharacterized protein n=1 Tax=Phyllobacterium zundukense TaxID=1867719 RepID=A0ACD4D931_9HYPH|nr:hypothetical protein [Phyllobacterium zundukense]UXN62452.1 hypothetical protein N8E88_20985 [Phyllobacterium zundukense]
MTSMNTELIPPTLVAGGKTYKRTHQEKKAITLLDSALEIADIKRLMFVRQIRAALRPTVEAKKLIKAEQLRRAGGNGPGSTTKPELDFSDILELEVLLRRRDLTLDTYQLAQLSAMNRKVLSGYPWKEFEKDSEALLLIENSNPAAHRRAEYDHSRASSHESSWLSDEEAEQECRERAEDDARLEAMIAEEEYTR